MVIRNHARKQGKTFVAISSAMSEPTGGSLEHRQEKAGEVGLSGYPHDV